MKRIVAFGNPLLDTIVTIRDDVLLRKYDLEPDGQKELSNSEMKCLKNDIKNFEKTVAAGGCAQNTLKVLQWLFQNNCSATMIGAIGADDEGQLLKQILNEHGVETNYIVDKDHPTGTTVALVNGTSRSLVAYLGAAESVPLNRIDSNMKKKIENADIVYMEGFFLTKRIETATFILNYCNSLNKVFAFNLSGEYLCKENPEVVTHFMKNSDIVFGNRKEFEALCAIMNEDNVENLVTNLSKENKMVLVTNGPSSILCIGNELKNCIQIEIPKLKNEEIKDTTGAGDSFVAGFLTGYLSDQSLKICSQLGCYAAQEIIKQVGCTVPEFSPTLPCTVFSEFQ